eukprot:scaffold238785_cov18-Prasinocladus_malaysianus.AAC.1
MPSSGDEQPRQSLTNRHHLQEDSVGNKKKNSAKKLRSANKKAGVSSHPTKSSTYNTSVEGRKGRAK